MSDFYLKITPETVHLHFKKEWLQAMENDVKDQILHLNSDDLPLGKGMFMYENLVNVNKKEPFKAALIAAWKYDVSAKAFTNFKILTYHIFTGEPPDEILDDMLEFKSRNWNLNNN